VEVEKMGLRVDLIEKLKNLGIETSEDIIYIGDKVLSDLLGISREKAMEIVREAYKYYQLELKPITEIKEKIEVLPSPFPSYNRFFGGFRGKRIYEFYGKFGSGKTNLMITIAVDSLLRGFKVIWFDSEGTLSYDRVFNILVERAKKIEYKGDINQLMKNFYVKRIGHSDEIIFASIRLGSLVRGFGARVIFFDSLTAPFRTDYAGMGELAERQMTLGYVMRNLLRCAEIFNLWIFFSNQVVSVISPTGNITHEAVSPIGGNVLQHLASEIYYLKKKGNKRIFSVKDVPDLPELEIPFKITNAGVEEVGYREEEEEENSE
jgi:RecA/RadA recombinase